MIHAHGNVTTIIVPEDEKAEVKRALVAACVAINEASLRFAQEKSADGRTMTLDEHEHIQRHIRHHEVLSELSNALRGV
jgi:hypothetical protein